MSGSSKQKDGGKGKKRSWIKRLLNIDVPEKEDDSSSEPIDQEVMAAAMEFGTLLHDAPYTEFPAPVRAKLRNPVETALEDKDAVTAKQKIGHFKAEVKRVAVKFEAWLQAETKLRDVEQDIAELTKLKWPDASGFASRAEAIRDEAEQGDFDGASDGVYILEQAVSDALPKARVRADYLKQRADLAADEDKVKKIKDIPANLKDLRDAYLTSAKRTQSAFDGGNFQGALDSLVQLKQDIDAAVQGIDTHALERTQLETETKQKVTNVKNLLNQNTANGKPAWQDVGSDEWKGAVDEVVKVQLDPEFQQRYDAICDLVAEDLAKDPVVKEGYKQWSKWSADPVKNKAKIEGVMKQILKLQSARLGIDPPTEASLYSDPDPEDCGGYDSDNYPPGEISLNQNSGDFGSFKELLDTLTHENTHAYQEKLIRGFRDGSIAPGSDEYNAAMILDMNDTATHGYVDPDDDDAYDKYCKDNGINQTVNPYMDQVCEKHAWGAGRKAGRAAYNAIKNNP